MVSCNDAKVVASPTQMQLRQFEKDLERLEKYKEQQQVALFRSIINSYK